MTNTDFNEPLLFKIPRPKVLWLVAFIMLGFALFILCCSGLAWPYKLIISVFSLGFSLLETRRYSKQPVKFIKRSSSGHWMLQVNSNDWIPAKLDSHHVISQRLIVIHLITDQKKYSFWLFKHQVMPDDFRRLSVFLRL